MASKIKVPPQDEKMPEKEGRETPLLDLSDAAVRELTSCHECDDVSNARPYAPGQILQFFEIAWQIIAWTHLKSDDGHIH